MSLANLLKKGSLRGFATATSATVATLGGISEGRSVATVATVAVAAVKINAVDPLLAELDAILNSGNVAQRLKAQRAY